MKLIFLFTLLAWVFFAYTTTGKAADCLACTKLSSEMKNSAENEEKAKALLEKNKAMLAQLPAEEHSQKIKLTSNILIFSVKIETMNNNRTVQNEEFQKAGCPQCQKM